MKLSRVLLLVLAALCAPLALAQDLPVALNGLDPVLLTEGVEQSGSAELVGADDRYTYRFANEQNRQRFLENKNQFKIQNEMCPVAPGIPGTSSLYAVHDGKIYIFATPGCIDAFESSPESYI